MKFIKNYEEMSAETYFAYKQAFNRIINKNLTNLTNESDMLNVLMSFCTDKDMIEVLASLLKLDYVTGIDEKIELVKAMNGKEINDAVQHFYDNFFFLELNQLGKQFQTLQQPTKKKR